MQTGRRRGNPGFFRFKDAFKQLRVAEQERHYLAGDCPAEGCFAYSRIMFGIASGPLTWGRVAAQLIRCPQSLSREESLAMACFVDDPTMGVAGTDVFRSRMFTNNHVIFWEQP